MEIRDVREGSKIHQTLDGFITMFDCNAATADRQCTFHIRCTITDNQRLFRRDSCGLNRA